MPGIVLSTLVSAKQINERKFAIMLMRKLVGKSLYIAPSLQ